MRERDVDKSADKEREIEIAETGRQEEEIRK